MERKKKLTSCDIKKVMGTWSGRTKTIQWHTVSFDVKPMLTVQEFITTIRSIIDDCRSADGQEFAVELLDFSIKTNIIAAYAYIELPDDINELFNIVYLSDLYETICRIANNKQISAIEKAAKMLAGVNS